MAILLGFGGLVMNVYVLLSCYFQRIVLINPVTGEGIPGSERGYGFLSKEVELGDVPDYRTCSYYPVDQYDLVFDSWMKAAKAFTFMSGVLGFVCFAVLILSCCLAFSPSMFERWLMWMYLFAAIFILLSFLAFGNEFCDLHDCKVAQGGGWAISAFLFWIVCANTVKSMAAADFDDYDNDDPDRDYYDDAPTEDGQDLYYETEEAKYAKPEPRAYVDDSEFDNDDEDGAFLNTPREFDEESEHREVMEDEAYDSDEWETDTERTDEDEEQVKQSQQEHQPVDLLDDQGPAPYEEQAPDLFQQEPAPYEPEAAPYEQEPAPYEHEPAPYEHEPAPYEQEPAPYEHEPAPYEQEPAPYEQGYDNEPPSLSSSRVGDDDGPQFA